MRVTFALISAVALTGCGKVPTYTLYRNSSIDAGMRIHWASFDAADKGINGGDYNLENCQLAVRLLTENMRRENAGAEPARFWCEAG